MPIVTVDALEGRTVEQKRGLVSDITEAVMKNFEVGPEAVIVIIRDMEKKNFAKAGKLRIDS